MSGGSLDGACFKLNYIIDDINCKLKDNFKTNIGEEYEGDYLNKCTSEQRKAFIEYIEQLLKDLRYKVEELHHLEWFLSGDYGYDSYKKEMNELEESK